MNKFEKIVLEMKDGTRRSVGMQGQQIVTFNGNADDKAIPLYNINTQIEKVTKAKSTLEFIKALSGLEYEGNDVNKFTFIKEFGRSL